MSRLEWFYFELLLVFYLCFKKKYLHFEIWRKQYSENHWSELKEDKYLPKLHTAN